MIRVSSEELIDNLQKYLEIAKKGDCVIILKNGIPVADLVPHRTNAEFPGWKRPIAKIKVKGESFTKLIRKMRDEARY